MEKSHFLFVFFLSLLLAGCCKDDNDPVPPSVTIHSAEITEGELLDLGKTVNFYYESTQEITQGVWTLEVPTESGENIIIFTQELESIGFTVITPDNIDAFIPDREDYLRTTSGMLAARVRLTGTFANGALASGEYAVELPYRPSKPTIEVCRIEDDFEKWESDVTVCFRSLGGIYYLINRRLTIGGSTTSYGVEADNYEFTLPAVSMDLEYKITIIAYNDYGSVKSDPIYTGGDPDYYLRN